MMSKIDEVFKKILNDRDIFWIKKEIFSEIEWNNLKTVKDQKEMVKKIDRKLMLLKEEKKSKSNEKEKVLNSCINLCENLKKIIEDKPNILNQLFENLKCFSLVHCNLPNMDDYGKVIERYNISIVEQFFLDKIKRENNQHRKKALQKVFEYVKELYNANVSPLEIAYFVRKLDSLTSLWEV